MTEQHNRAPVGVHLGVVCDETMNPIAGYRYTRRGSSPSYDLCQAEFDKLSSEEQVNFERVAPPLTPRRALIGLGAAAAAVAASSLVPPFPREDPLLFYDDFIEMPPLSPAEALVGFIFKPKIPATEREIDPRSARRLPIASSGGGPLLLPRPASAAECDDECKQRIADRRALFEQSRTTSNRQVLFDLSRQRAALYNTTYQGASCIKGLPCW
jgi:hypothetical protein